MGVDVRLLVCHDAWYLSCTRLTATGGWGGVPLKLGIAVHICCVQAVVAIGHCHCDSVSFPVHLQRRSRCAHPMPSLQRELLILRCERWCKGVRVLFGCETLYAVTSDRQVTATLPAVYRFWNRRLKYTTCKTRPSLLGAVFVLLLPSEL